MLLADTETAIHLRINIEKHTVGLSVPEALALGISLASSAAKSEGVLGAGTVKVVCRCVFGVSNDSATCRAVPC